jgi:hypothetical protein
MNTIEFEHGSFSVPVEIVAAGLDIEVELVRPLMHQNKITSLCERGVGEDAGRFRLTFFHADQLFHLVVEGEGRIVQISTKERDPRGRPPTY